MPGIDINIKMARKGPMFSGKTAAALGTYADQVEYRLATYAEDLVQERLAASLQNPTGYYQSKVTVQRSGSGYLVWDQGVIYGAWLEGVGSRNAPVTRFAGYSAFRRAKAMTNQKAPQIAAELLARYKAMGLI